MDITIETIQPLKNFIIVRPIQRAEETSSGFVMPEESYKATPVAGIVTACGTEVKEIAIGDTVFFRRFSIDELKFTTADGSQDVASLISEDEIVGKVKK